MKYSLSYNIDNEFLRKADEIKLRYKDKAVFDEYAEKFPKANFTVKIGEEDKSIDWNLLDSLNKMYPNRFLLCLPSITLCGIAKIWKIPFYYAYPISNFYDLKLLKDLGVSYVYLSAPIFFQLPDVAKLGIKVRAIANVAETTGLRSNGLHGCWIRPENVDDYENFIDIIEFDGVNLKQEETLFKIYQKKKWQGYSNLLFINFNIDVRNNLINPALTAKRINCRQICESKNLCNICDRIYTLCQQENIDKLTKEIEKEQEILAITT